jgi:hypothetical protein
MITGKVRTDIDDIFVKLQLGRHPVAAVQYSTVHYSTVQYSAHLHVNITQNNTIDNFVWKAFWDSNPDWSN